MAVSYEEVKIVADQIVAEGGEPEVREIWKRLGRRGSFGTIHKHLKRYREERPRTASPPAQLSAPFLATISAEISRARAEASSVSEAEVIRLQQEADDLAGACEEAERERDEARGRVDLLATERDELKETVNQNHLEIKRLKEDLERERSSAEHAQMETAQTRFEIQSHKEQAAKQTADFERLNADLESQAKKLGEAEQRALVAETKLETQQDLLKAAQVAEKRALDDLERMHEFADRERDRADKHDQTIADLRETLATLKAQSAAAERKKAGRPRKQQNAEIQA